MVRSTYIERIRHVVDYRDTWKGRVFDDFVLGMILLSLITFTLKTIPGLSDQAHSFLHWVEVAIVVLFTLEYGLRCYVAFNRTGYVLSFYGIIDLLAILPFYLMVFGLGYVDGRVLRVLRVLRIFRIIKLFRYNQAVDRLQRAVEIVKEEIIMFAVLSVILIYLAAAGIWYFENSVQPDKFGSVLDGLWWAVVTLTTVGYGDTYPVTGGGRIFTFILLMIGLGVIAIPPGIIASALSKARAEQDRKES